MKEITSPFVFCFSTNENHYIYDVNSNKVFEADSVICTIINDYSPNSSTKLIRKYGDRFSEEEIRTACSEINEAQQKGIFASRRPEKMTFGIDIKTAIKEQLCEQLILNVTDACNLRCSYCVFSGCYEGHKLHSQKYMSEETALKAVDYFLVHSPDKINIGFYGGEPLLAFPLIRKIAGYIKGKSDKQVGFSMTTNGILLGKQEIVDFLIDNNFNVTVSLDGPAEVHNRYRKTIDNSDSFNTITSNLRHIKESYSDYYKTKILFSVVNAPPYRIYTTLDFFTKNGLVNMNNVTTSFVNPSKNSFFDGIEMDEIGEKERNLDYIYDIYYKMLLAKENTIPFVKSFVEKYLFLFYHRPKVELDTIPVNGCCIPGVRRQFVDIDGSIYLCEKVSCCQPIGNIYEGLDIAKIDALINEYMAISGDCYNCWASRLCPICFATAQDAGKISAERKQGECNAVRKRLAEVMQLYYSISEKEPQIFNLLFPEQT